MMLSTSRLAQTTTIPDTSHAITGIQLAKFCKYNAFIGNITIVVGQGGKELDALYSDWMSTKRPPQIEELLDGMWKKIGDHGYAFVVRFLPDGTFTWHLDTDRDRYKDTV